MPPAEVISHSIERSNFVFRACAEHLATQKTIDHDKNLDTSQDVTKGAQAAMAAVMTGSIALSKITALSSAMSPVATTLLGGAGHTTVAGSGLQAIFSLTKMARAYHLAKKNKDPSLIKKFWESESGVKTIVTASLGLAAGACMIAFAASSPIVIALAASSVAVQNIADIAFSGAKAHQAKMALLDLKKKMKHLTDRSLSTQERALKILPPEKLRQFISSDSPDKKTAPNKEALSPDEIAEFNKKASSKKERPALSSLIFEEKQAMLEKEKGLKKQLAIHQKKLVISLAVTGVSAIAFTLLAVGLTAANPVILGIGAALVCLTAIFGLVMTVKGIIEKNKTKKKGKLADKSKEEKPEKIPPPNDKPADQPTTASPPAEGTIADPDKEEPDTKSPASDKAADQPTVAVLPAEGTIADPDSQPAADLISLTEKEHIMPDGAKTLGSYSVHDAYSSQPRDIDAPATRRYGTNISERPRSHSMSDALINASTDGAVYFDAPPTTQRRRPRALSADADSLRKARKALTSMSRSARQSTAQGAGIQHSHTGDYASRTDTLPSETGSRQPSWTSSRGEERTTPFTPKARQSATGDSEYQPPVSRGTNPV